jgi:DNA transformation protein
VAGRARFARARPLARGNAVSDAAAMPVSREFLDHVADQLQGFGPLAIRRLFGGAGLFRGARMFGLVADDTLYFKVGEANRAAYVAAGAKPFSYRRRGATASLTSYYEVPAAVLDDPEALAEWARCASSAAQAAGAKPRRRAAAKTKR